MKIDLLKSFWTFPCNIDLYDPIGAFAELQVIDWRQSVKLQEGDEVFIYCSKPYQKIMFRTKVVKTCISEAEVDTSDLRFNRNGEMVGNTPRFGYARLKLMNCRDQKELALKQLVENGLHRAPQGPMRVSEELYTYLIRYLCD